MKLIVASALLFISASLSGCGQVSLFGKTLGEKTPASEAKPVATAAHDAAPTSSTQRPTIQKVKSVTLVLTPQAVAKVGNDERFNSDALLAAINSELQARKLLDNAGSQAGTVEIAIDGYAMRPTSNVILFGNIISAGSLNGSISVRDALGHDLQNRRIDAQSRVSIPANGASTNPLASLYREFAVMTANLLDGTPAKPIFGADQHPR